MYSKCMKGFPKLHMVQAKLSGSSQALERATAEKRTSPFSRSINSRHTLAASYREMKSVTQSWEDDSLL